MRALVVALGLCVAAGCGDDSGDTASNETGGAGGGTSSGGGGATSDGGSWSGGAGGKSGASGGGSAGASGGSGTGGSSGSGGSTSGGSSGGGAGGGTSCPQQVSETKAPGAIVNDSAVGYQGWTNPSYAKTSDDLRATSPALPPTRTTSRLVGNAFGFQIPANATILGIELAIERSKGGLGTAQDLSVRVGKASGAAPLNPIKTAAWPVTDASVTYGGATELWGTTWTPAEISDPAFEAFIRASSEHATENVNPRVDSMQVTVHYVFDACAP